MLLISNPGGRRRRRKASAGKKRRSRRRNPMPFGLAKFHAKRRRHGAKRRRSGARRHVARRRNPSLRGIFGQVMPMTMEAATGAIGSIGLDWLWGQINPRLPPAMQSISGKVGVGDVVKIGATVAIGQLASGATRGFSKRAAQGALTVQLERIIKSFLPDTIRMQLAYAQPAQVITGQYFTGPNRVRKGSSLQALQRPGGRSPLLSSVGALQRPGGRSQLLSLAPDETDADSGLRF